MLSFRTIDAGTDLDRFVGFIGAVSRCTSCTFGNREFVTQYPTNDPNAPDFTRLTGFTGCANLCVCNSATGTCCTNGIIISFYLD